MLRVILGNSGRKLAPGSVASIRGFGTTPGIDQVRLVEDLVGASQHSAKEIVPWFIKNMPV